MENNNTGRLGGEDFGDLDLLSYSIRALNIMSSEEIHILSKLIEIGDNERANEYFLSIQRSGRNLWKMFPKNDALISKEIQKEIRYVLSVRNILCVESSIEELDAIVTKKVHDIQESDNNTQKK